VCFTCCSWDCIQQFWLCTAMNIYTFFSLVTSVVAAIPSFDIDADYAHQILSLQLLLFPTLFIQCRKGYKYWIWSGRHEIEVNVCLGACEFMQNVLNVWGYYLQHRDAIRTNVSYETERMFFTRRNACKLIHFKNVIQTPTKMLRLDT